MKISSVHILFLILIYPFFYVSSYVAFDVGYLFSVYYFILVTFFLTLLNFRKIPANIFTNNVANFGLLAAIMVIVLLNTNDLRYSKPLVFFIFVCSFYVLSLTLKFNVNNKLIQNFFVFLLLLSIIFLGNDERYLDDRYCAFFISPTVYSVYTEAFLILFLCFSKSPRLKIGIFLIAGFFILLTKTRLNLFFYFTIPIMIYYLDKFYKSKFKIVLIYIICLNLLYPIYSFIVKSELGKSSLVTSRYDDGRDASFGLRNYLNTFVYKEYISNSTPFQKIFGRGTEMSRKVMVDKMGQDILPHNDFIRFTLDFGLLCTLLYLIFLYRIAKSNYVSLLLFLLYLFSFYHNMIYDFFLVALIIYFSHVKKEIVMEKNIIGVI